MAASFRTITAAAAVACATAVRAATESYQLSEEYTADNFFDKFDFFTSTYTSGDSWDSTHGYVQYRGQADAESLGLISTSSGGIYIGPDTNSTYDPTGKGRDSVRLTSKATYNEGLMIAKFSHMPAQACGAWPAFWSYGSPWLTLGEIDYFEGWNLMEYNRMAMHTNESIAGSCSLTTTGVEGTVLTEDCNNEADGTGCGVKDASGVWSSTTGATFAMEWTEAAIKVWSWLPSAVPSDITAGTPDPSASAWGNPTLLVEQANCDLSRSFGNQQLVFNIDFCGDTAGSPTFWNQTCSAQVGDTCANYVASNPSAFAETYFMIEGIQYYTLGQSAEVSVTASATLVAPAATSAAAGLLDGAGSVLESTLGATASTAPASSSGQDAAVTEAVEPPHQHTTSYIYGTSTSTDEFGAETTVVVVVDTTICPVTAAEASQTSSVVASESSLVVAAQTAPATQTVATTTTLAGVSPTARTTLTSYSTLTSHRLTTSTIFSTSLSTITSCAPTASASCSVGDVTTVVIAVSTTICPVTAAEASANRKASSLVASASSAAFSVPAPSGAATSQDSPVQASASSSHSLSAALSKSSAVVSTPTHTSSTLTALAAASSTTTPASSKASTTLAAHQGTTEVVSATEIDGGLETATGTPTSISLEWMTAATAAASAAAYNSGNGTVTGSSASATQTNSCSGLDCIVVSSSGSQTGTIGASGLALVVIAGAMFLF